MSLPLRSAFVATSALALTLLPACSNSSSGSSQSGNPGSSAEAPIASIQFPFGANPVTDQERMIVRGAAADPDGIQSVELTDSTGAVRAVATTTDAFATWEADVALSPGLNTFSVRTRDLLGNVNPMANSVSVRSVGPFLTSIGSGSILPPSNDAIVWDENLQALFLIDSSNGGMRTLISGAGLGNGPALEGVQQIIADSLGNTIYVLTEEGLLYVNRPSGERFVLSGEPGGVASGPALSSASKMLLDESGNRMIVARYDSGTDTGSILSVNLFSGARDVLSAEDLGIGVNVTYRGPTGLALDELGQTLYVSNWFGANISSVDLALSTQEVLSGINPLNAALVGMGAPFEEVGDLVLDSAQNRLLALDRGLPGIVAVDLMTGNRTLLPLDAAATQALSSATSLSAAENGGLLLTSSSSVLNIDPATGASTTLTETRTGQGTSLAGTDMIDAHLRASELLLQRPRLATQPEGFEIVNYDLRSGQRSVVASDLTGSGVTVLRQDGFVCERSFGTIYGLGRIDDAGTERLALYSTDLATGVRTLLHAYDASVAPLVADIQLDDRNKYAFMAFGNRIDRYEFVTAELTTTTGPGVGSGPMLTDVQRIVNIQTTRDLLVTDSLDMSLFRVRSLNGERVLLSSTTMGSGTSIGQPVGLAGVNGLPEAIICDLDPPRLIKASIDGPSNRRLLFDIAGDALFPNVRPRDVAWDGVRRIAYVLLGDGFDGLLAVDAVNGQRVLIAR